MNKTRMRERRQHKRYYVKNRLFAVVRSDNHKLDKIGNMSKGEIAFAVMKSQPPRMGEIKEISQGGLSFHYIENGSELNGFSEMDILFVDENFHLCRIPFKTIADARIETNDPFDTLAMNRLTVKFGGLSSRQMLQLDHVIKNFTTGEVSKKRNQQAWGSRPS